MLASLPCTTSRGLHDELAESLPPTQLKHLLNRRSCQPIEPGSSPDRSHRVMPGRGHPTSYGGPALARATTQDQTGEGA
jgi:hypothetical protein